MTNQPIDCILLPGLHGTEELYTPLIKALDKLVTQKELVLNFKTVTYPINIKQSYESLTEWVSQELDFNNSKQEKIVIIAESFSTPISLYLADLYPEKVSAVIVASGFCASPVNMSFALLPLRPLFILSPPRAALRHFLLGDDATKEKLNELRATLNSIPSKMLSQRLRSVLTLEETNIPSIPKTPLLLLQAQNDGLIPWEDQNQLESHLPHSETHWIDSPHLLFQSRPKIAAKHIIEFISNLVYTKI